MTMQILKLFGLEGLCFQNVDEVWADLGAFSERASRGGDENVERWPDLPVNNHYIHCNT